MEATSGKKKRSRAEGGGGARVDVALLMQQMAASYSAPVAAPVASSSGKLVAAVKQKLQGDIVPRIAQTEEGGAAKWPPFSGGGTGATGRTEAEDEGTSLSGAGVSSQDGSRAAKRARKDNSEVGGAAPSARAASVTIGAAGNASSSRTGDISGVGSVPPSDAWDGHRPGLGPGLELLTAMFPGTSASLVRAAARE
jgi:hypothetical protein